MERAFGCVGTNEANDVSLALVAHPRLVATITAWDRLGDGIAGIGVRPPGRAPTRAPRSALLRLRLTALVDDG